MGADLRCRFRSLLWGALLAPLLACAQPAADATSDPLSWDALDGEQQALLAPFSERWMQLPLGQRAQLLANAERLRRLPEAERAEVKQRLERWQSLPADERAGLRQRYEAFQALSPDQQRRLRHERQRFRDLPPEQRDALRQRFEQMGPRERRAFLLGAGARDQAEQAQRAFPFVPREERAATLEMFRLLEREDRQRLRRLIERMPPWRREEVRQSLLSMTPDARSAWLRGQVAQP